MVMYGFEYLHKFDCAADLMAFIDWSYNLEGKSYNSDILRIDVNYIEHTYRWRHIIVSLVQAINRIHCRKMIEGGNCPATDVYLFLNKKEELDIIQRHTQKLMPNVQFSTCNAPKTDCNSKGLSKSKQLIVDFLGKCTNETIKATDLIKSIDGLKAYNFNNNISPELSTASGDLHESLQAIGWEYISAKQAKELYGESRKMFVRTNS